MLTAPAEIAGFSCVEREPTLRDASMLSRLTQNQWGGAEKYFFGALLALLRRSRRLGGDELFKTRVASQIIPLRVQLQNAVSEIARDILERGDLCNGQILLAGPGIDLRQVDGKSRAINPILGNGHQLAGAAPFANRI